MRQSRKSSFNELHRLLNGLSTSRWDAFTVRWKLANAPAKTPRLRWRRLRALDEPHRVFNEALEVRRKTKRARHAVRSAPNEVSRAANQFSAFGSVSEKGAIFASNMVPFSRAMR